MSADRLNEDKPAVRLADEFDRTLSRALQRHSESSPGDFTSMVLRQIEQADQQRILARVLLQERLALAACIALAGLTVVVATVFPETAAAAFRGIASGMTAGVEGLIDRVPQAIESFGAPTARHLPQTSGQSYGLLMEWRLYTILGAVFGFTIYSLAELFVGDRATMA